MRLSENKQIWECDTKILPISRLVCVHRNWQSRYHSVVTNLTDPPCFAAVYVLVSGLMLSFVDNNKLGTFWSDVMTLFSFTTEVQGREKALSGSWFAVSDRDRYWYIGPTQPTEILQFKPLVELTATQADCHNEIHIFMVDLICCTKRFCNRTFLYDICQITFISSRKTA